MSLHGYPAGRNHVDRDTEGSQLGRHAASPTVLPALGGHVGTEIRHAPLKVLAANINDPPPTPRLHVRQHGSGEQKRTFDKKASIDWQNSQSYSSIGLRGWAGVALTTSISTGPS